MIRSADRRLPPTAADGRLADTNPWRNAMSTYTVQEIVTLVAKGKMNQKQACEELAKLEAPAQAISFKVSEKGGVSVYGLQRWPMTLYGEQWQRLLAQKDQILDFIRANKAKLSTKDSPKRNGKPQDEHAESVFSGMLPG
jgi:hypothetical protein